MDLANHITAVLDEQERLDGPGRPEETGRPEEPGRGLSRPAQQSTAAPAHDSPPDPPHPPEAPSPRAQAPSLGSQASHLLSDPELLGDLLHDYLEGVKLHEIARNHLLDLADLVAVLESPQVVRLLDDLTRHAQLQSERLITLARPVAIAKLKNLVETDPANNRLLPPKSEIASRETTRKSAAQLERISKPPKANAPVPRARPVCEGSAPQTGAASPEHVPPACEGPAPQTGANDAEAPAAGNSGPSSARSSPASSPRASPDHDEVPAQRRPTHERDNSGLAQLKADPVRP